jgi:hypothetical protein
MKKESRFTISPEKKELAKKVFASFQNETLKELGDKVVGGIWIEVHWGQSTKPPKQVEQQITPAGN